MISKKCVEKGRNVRIVSTIPEFDRNTIKNWAGKNNCIAVDRPSTNEFLVTFANSEDLQKFLSKIDEMCII